MRPIYNDELYHYGKIGMKWGRRKQHNMAIKEARNNLKTDMHNYQQNREKYLRSDSRKVAKKYEDSEKKFRATQKLATQKTTGEKVSGIVGKTLGTMGALTLTAYLASKK